MKKVVKKSSVLLIIILLLVVVSSSSCSNSLSSKGYPQSYVHGFWGGLGDGITAPFFFLSSVICNADIVIWETNYNEWYVVGFLLGIILVYMFLRVVFLIFKGVKDTFR